MTEIFKKISNPKIVLSLILLVALGVILLNLIIDSRFKSLENEAKLNIANQKTTLLAIAETTARNGADSVTELIVKDCSTKRRSQFEDLLNRLNQGLSNNQLSELERLFGRCGSFYSERKSVMTSRLAREIEVFEVYVKQLGTILNKDVAKDYSLEKWTELAEAEKSQSLLFAELVLLQDKIISTLLSGKSPSSEEITEILKEVKEVQESLIYSNKQAANVRTELAAL